MHTLLYATTGSFARRTKWKLNIYLPNNAQTQPRYNRRSALEKKRFKDEEEIQCTIIDVPQQDFPFY